MKRIVSLLLILTFLLTAGCAKSDNDILQNEAVVYHAGSDAASSEEETPSLPTKENPDSEETEESTEKTNQSEPEPTPLTEETVLRDFSELEPYLNEKDYAILLGKRVGYVQTQIEGSNYYNTIQIQAKEVYYGNLQPNTQINFREIVGTFRLPDGSETTQTITGLEPLNSSYEYLMVLRRKEDPETGEEYYTYITEASRPQTYAPITARKLLALRVETDPQPEDLFLHSLMERFGGEKGLDLSAKEMISKNQFRNFSELNYFLKKIDFIIVQAQKSGKAREVVDQSLEFPYKGTFRFPMTVTKVYSGDLNVGDSFEYWELIGRHFYADDLEVTALYPGLEPIEDSTEYLMILQKETIGTDTFYTILPQFAAYCSYVPISEQSAISERIRNGTAEPYDSFRQSVFEEFLK